MGKFYLPSFVSESNRIEGILRTPTVAEIDAHAAFLSQPRINIDDLCALVAVCAPRHRLRDRRGLNVRVGNHIAPPGGPEIREALERLLSRVGITDAYETHVAYETLHPFTDGNGRSGRALWMWQKLTLCDEHEARQAASLGFLHTFYYETLAHSRPSEKEEANG